MWRSAGGEGGEGRRGEGEAKERGGEGKIKDNVAAGISTALLNCAGCGSGRALTHGAGIVHEHHLLDEGRRGLQ